MNEIKNTDSKTYSVETSKIPTEIAFEISAVSRILSKLMRERSKLVVYLSYGAV